MVAAVNRFSYGDNVRLEPAVAAGQLQADPFPMELQMILKASFVICMFDIQLECKKKCKWAKLVFVHKVAFIKVGGRRE